MKQRVLVAMSGGVDSSVAAALLVEQGFDVIGVTMQLWDYTQNKEQTCDPNDKFDTCCSLDDVADARAVAHRLGIPFYVFDYQDDFKENVVDYFVTEYLRGMTPNPCVACNTFLKFDHLLDRASRLGCQFVATGHYAQVSFCKEKGYYTLRQGLDPNKDQSYFLYALNQEKLAKVLFPLGHLAKAEVRSLAEKFSLINAQKKESMEICFIPNNDYAKFVAARTENNDLVITGEIRHENGQSLGSHAGIHQFTVGQRRGLGVSSGSPLYVTRIDPETGTVFVGEESFLYREGFTFKNFHTVRPLQGESSFHVKIRYRSQPVNCFLERQEDLFSVRFQDKQKSVTPGQIAVLYKNDEVVGGGFIDKVLGSC